MGVFMLTSVQAQAEALEFPAPPGHSSAVSTHLPCPAFTEHLRTDLVLGGQAKPLPATLWLTSFQGHMFGHSKCLLTGRVNAELCLIHSVAGAWVGPPVSISQDLCREWRPGVCVNTSTA